MSKLHQVCPLEELPEGKGHAVTIDDYNLALFRIGTDVYAIADNCTHQDFPLNGGRVLKDRVKCRAHGAEFCLKTGKALCSPAFAPVETFAVQVIEGVVFVELD